MIPTWALAQKQSLPLESKIRLAEIRIRQWYEHWNGQVYVSFSGGRDSTVLLRLVRAIYPNVQAVFANTGLEFPEILEFVRSFDNVVWIKPAMTFRAVIEKYGYPVVSKEQAQRISEARHTKSDKLRAKRLSGPHGVSKKWQHLLTAPFEISDRCCHVMKKRPFAKYEKETGNHGYLGTMAAESKFRKQSYLRYGCNAFDGKRPTSKPMSVWLQHDVEQYIKEHDVEVCSVYAKGWSQTGCVFCAFGAHMENEPNRFQRMCKTHPKLWSYCMDKLGMREVLKYVGIPIE